MTSITNGKSFRNKSRVRWASLPNTINKGAIQAHHISRISNPTTSIKRAVTKDGKTFLGGEEWALGKLLPSSAGHNWV